MLNTLAVAVSSTNCLRFPSAPSGSIHASHLTDVISGLRVAYQRDGRLAAAAALRRQSPTLSLSDALSTIDDVLGLRKPTAIF